MASTKCPYCGSPDPVQHTCCVKNPTVTGVASLMSDFVAEVNKIVGTKGTEPMPNSALKNPKRVNEVKLGQPPQPSRMVKLTRLYERLQAARQEVHDIEIEIEKYIKLDPQSTCAKCGHELVAGELAYLDKHPDKPRLCLSHLRQWEAKKGA